MGRRFRELQKAWRWVPSLHAAGSDPPTFDVGCSLVLIALGDPEWQGKWRLDSAERAQLLDLMENDDEFGQTHNRMLTMEMITSFIGKERNRERVRSLPSSATGILVKDLVQDALLELDTDGNKALDLNEWNDFLDKLEVLHLQYLLAKAFQEFRAFWGRGQEWHIESNDSSPQELLLSLKEHSGSSWFEEPVEPNSGAACQLELCRGEASNTPGKLHTFQFGLDPDLREGQYLPTGWLSDLYYYSANNHPIHGIFACDEDHRLTWLERLAIELATLSFSLLAKGMQMDLTTTHALPLKIMEESHVYSLLFITLPGMTLWWVLFLLFTCPKCGFADEAKCTSAEGRRAQLFTNVGAAIGYSIVAIGLVYLGARIVIRIFGRADLCETCTRWEYPSHVLYARAQGYIISWMMIVGVYFNPWVAWGQPDPRGAFCLGDLGGLGQWRIEKQKFQARCMEAYQHLDRNEARPGQGSFGSLISEEPRYRLSGVIDRLNDPDQWIGSSSAEYRSLARARDHLVVL